MSIKNVISAISEAVKAEQARAEALSICVAAGNYGWGQGLSDPYDDALEAASKDLQAALDAYVDERVKAAIFSASQRISA